jgi:hypothetical protein
MKFFEVKVELRYEDDNGKAVKRIEPWIVEAESVTDAEASITKEFEGSIVEFEVKSATEKKIAGILFKPKVK